MTIGWWYGPPTPSVIPSRETRSVVTSGQPEDADPVDRALAVQARTDPAALERLCLRHLDRVHRLAMLRTRNRAAAEAVTLATFERAAREFGDLDPDAVGPAAWFCHLAAVELSTGGHVAPGRSTPGVLDGLDRLKPREQQVIALSFMCDLSDSEVAAALGRSRATVALALERAVVDFAERAEVAGHRLAMADAVDVLASFASVEASPPDPTLAERVVEALRAGDRIRVRRRSATMARPGRLVAALVVLGALAFLALALLADGGPPTVELIEGADLTILLPDGNEIEPEPGLGVPPGSTVITGPDGFARFENGTVGPDATAEIHGDRVEVVGQPGQP